MFAIRKVPFESLRFFPNELVFCHRVSDPFDVVGERWSGSGRRNVEPLLEFVTSTRSQLSSAPDLARDNLGRAKARRKVHYDMKQKVKTFYPGGRGARFAVLMGIPCCEY